MKLQHISIVFVLIFIPILLVTSYFISLQVQTIKMESSYNEKLLTSAHDAMRAFELNTANEDLSAVSDSLRSIIDASTNIFFNTLCTNLGISNASKSYIQPYIPAILYTLYDGYYIYSPTNLAEICTDSYGRTIRTSDFGVRYKETITDANGNKLGVYEFNQDAIKYNDENEIEPEGLNDNSYVVNYLSLDSAIKKEYGQILYKNNDGTYSTELHSIPGKYDASTYYKRSYILKSYIPYSARYSNIDKNGNYPSGEIPYNITINYTLDNFLTVEGMIGNTYYTKSGYLTKKDLVKEIDANGTIINGSNWSQISEDVIKEYIENPSLYEVKVTLSDGITISNRDGKVQVSSSSGTGVEDVYWDDAASAVQYYVDTFVFSNWFYERLSEIPAKNLKNTQYSVSDIQNLNIDDITKDSDDKAIQTDLYKDMLHNFEGDNTKPFNTNESNDPESEESDFYTHKRFVIKNSITYNLILSMLVYTEESRTVEFNMPVFQDSEWDIILNNISIVSFMEGFKCGLKYFNNYAIVTSTNNEISVTDNEIYYVPRVLQGYGGKKADGSYNYIHLSNIEDDDTDWESYGEHEDVLEIAHRIDCEDLVLGGDDNFIGDKTNPSNWLGCISFKSKEIKYDKILNSDGSYTYDHKAYTDYNCIVDSNYTVKNRDGSIVDGNNKVLKYLLDNRSNPDGGLNLSDNFDVRLKAYRIAIAKERNNLYKTTAFPENYGWQTVPGSSSAGTSVSVSLPGYKLSEISKIEVIIENAENGSAGVYTDNISATYSNGRSYDLKQTIATTSKSRRTLEFKQDFTDSSNVSNVQISSQFGTKFDVVGVKIYFK